MLAVAEALERVLAAVAPLPAETLNLAEGLGRVLAEPLTARVTQPPAAVSAMDGYAVRGADVAAPARLAVIGSAPAGRPFGGSVGPGQAVRIFTGAPLPEGSDTIVIQENTRRDGDWVEVTEATALARFVRPAGLDFRAGEVGLPAGRRLTARDIGLAAAMNRPWLSVHRRPRVAIMATGDEIVLPGDPVAPGQIVSSNALALAAFVTAEGGQPSNLGIAADSPEALQRLAEQAKGADIVVTSGGASVGEHDLVQSALAPVGLQLDFWKIAMRPGKPLIFGRLGPVPLLGLPGNPVSSLVCALLFLRPLLRRLQGLPPELPPLRATLGTALPANDERQDYLRARLERDSEGRLVAYPFKRQDSSMLALLAGADGLVVRPPHAPALAAGADVALLTFDGGALSV